MLCCVVVCWGVLCCVVLWCGVVWCVVCVCCVVLCCVLLCCVVFVSYTHLTLPTNREVESLVVRLAYKKNKPRAVLY